MYCQGKIAVYDVYNKNKYKIASKGGNVFYKGKKKYILIWEYYF